MSSTDDYIDDDENENEDDDDVTVEFSHNDITVASLSITEFKRVQAQQRTDLRRRIEQRQELRRMRDELGIYSDLGSNDDYGL
ncbi:MAG: hypothetical protein DHS20C12_28720 [Pseudohongiella sp.]|nr:MAG: hypothetical protein DHS20C12_28720 [Pseudohongiella sp.]